METFRYRYNQRLLEQLRKDFYRLNVGPIVEEIMNNNEAYKCYFCRKYDDGRAPYRVAKEGASSWEYFGMCPICYTRLEEDSAWRRSSVGRIVPYEETRNEKGIKWLLFFFGAGALFGAVAGPFLLIVWGVL
jgi:hypothetical protein